MSFRKNNNRDDEWIAFRTELGEFFELFVAGDLTSVHQKDFEEYLSEGSNPRFHTSISELTDIKFLFLEKIANAWASVIFGYDAFYAERIKRFDSYD